MRLEPRASRLGGPRTLGHCYKKKKVKIEKDKSMQKKKEKKKKGKKKEEKMSCLKKLRIVKFHNFFKM